MNQLGVYNDCQMNVEASAAFLREAKEYSVLVNPTMPEKKMTGEDLLCAFVETPTAIELFEKERNMDRRNVEERTFAAGGRVFDFTV